MKTILIILLCAGWVRAEVPCMDEEAMECCIRGYTYVLPYEWVVCADHEDIAATWKPDSTWIVYFKNNQPIDWKQK